MQILQNIGLENVVMSTITAMELLQGMGNKAELKKMQKVIKQYHIIGFNEKIAQLALELTAKYSLSHHLQIPDCIIGATAIVLEMPLFTYNLKDFGFLPNIRLYQ